MLKRREVIIVIISLIVMSACNVEEKSKFDAEMTQQKQNQIERKALAKEKYDPYKKARDEFFMEVLKIENKRKKALPLKNAYAMSISKSSNEIVFSVAPQNKQEFDELELPPPPPEAEFIDYTPVVIEEREAIELDIEEFGTIAEIQGLAMEAKMTGDDTKLINYLKGNDLYELCHRKADQLEIDDGREDGESGGYGGSSSGNNKKYNVSIENLQSKDFIDGDVFVKYDKSSSGSSNNGSSSSGSNILNMLIPGHWGHAAFLDIQKRENNDNYFLLSASDQTDQGGIKVGYDKVKGYWSNATEVAICRVKNQSQYTRKNSIEYAKQFIGKPYGVNCKRMSNSSFYCSKVVYRGWLSQGIELEPHNNWIKVCKFWRWNYKKKWGVKFWYPEFKTSYIKDPWVTPSDLYEDNDVQVIRKLNS